MHSLGRRRNQYWAYGTVGGKQAVHMNPAKATNQSQTRIYLKRKDTAYLCGPVNNNRERYMH